MSPIVYPVVMNLAPSGKNETITVVTVTRIAKKSRIREFEE